MFPFTALREGTLVDAAFTIDVDAEIDGVSVRADELFSQVTFDPPVVQFDSNVNEDKKDVKLIVQCHAFNGNEAIGRLTLGVTVADPNYKAVADPDFIAFDVQ